MELFGLGVKALWAKTDKSDCNHLLMTQRIKRKDTNYFAITDK
jgi:hypothetical protein